jgi:hypothetical protein
VRVVAVSGDRRENIVYWTRLGEALPTSGREQRAALLGDAVKGFIPDGVLVRASLVSGDSKAAFAILENFVPALLAAVPRAHRASLIGTACAKSMSAAGVSAPAPAPRPVGRAAGGGARGLQSVSEKRQEGQLSLTFPCPIGL